MMYTDANDKGSYSCLPCKTVYTAIRTIQSTGHYLMRAPVQSRHKPLLQAQIQKEFERSKHPLRVSNWHIFRRHTLTHEFCHSYSNMIHNISLPANWLGGVV